MSPGCVPCPAPPLPMTAQPSLARSLLHRWYHFGGRHPACSHHLPIPRHRAGAVAGSAASNPWSILLLVHARRSLQDTSFGPLAVEPGNCGGGLLGRRAWGCDLWSSPWTHPNQCLAEADEHEFKRKEINEAVRDWDNGLHIQAVPLSSHGCG